MFEIKRNVGQITLIEALQTIIRLKKKNNRLNNENSSLIKEVAELKQLKKSLENDICDLYKKMEFMVDFEIIE